MCLFLAAWYPADTEEYLGATPEEVTSINMFTRDLEVESDWDLADLTDGPGLGSRASIHCDYGRLREAC